MANINYDINRKNISEYPNSFKRQDAFPLENYEIFKTLADAFNYAKDNPVAYIGQTIKVVNGGTDNGIYQIIEPKDKSGENAEHYLLKIATEEDVAALTGIDEGLREDIESLNDTVSGHAASIEALSEIIGGETTGEDNTLSSRISTLETENTTQSTQIQTLDDYTTEGKSLTLTYDNGNENITNNWKQGWIRILNSVRVATGSIDIGMVVGRALTPQSYQKISLTYGGHVKQNTSLTESSFDWPLIIQKINKYSAEKDADTTKITKIRIGYPKQNKSYYSSTSLYGATTSSATSYPLFPLTKGKGTGHNTLDNPINCYVDIYIGKPKSEEGNAFGTERKNYFQFQMNYNGYAYNRGASPIISLDQALNGPVKRGLEKEVLNEDEKEYLDLTGADLNNNYSFTEEFQKVLNDTTTNNNWLNYGIHGEVLEFVEYDLENKIIIYPDTSEAVLEEYALKSEIPSQLNLDETSINTNDDNKIQISGFNDANENAVPHVKVDSDGNKTLEWKVVESGGIETDTNTTYNLLDKSDSTKIEFTLQGSDKSLDSIDLTNNIQTLIKSYLEASSITYQGKFD